MPLLLLAVQLHHRADGPSVGGNTEQSLGVRLWVDGVPATHTGSRREGQGEQRERERERRMGGSVEAAPDVAALARVGVDGVNAAHRADGGAVLRHVQVVAGLRELRRLVGVQHHDPHRRLVLEGAFLQVARVHKGVGDLHREGVGVAGLVVQQLPGVREEDESQSGEGESSMGDTVFDFCLCCKYCICICINT